MGFDPLSDSKDEKIDAAEDKSADLLSQPLFSSQPFSNKILSDPSS